MAFNPSYENIKYLFTQIPYVFYAHVNYFKPNPVLSTVIMFVTTREPVLLNGEKRLLE